KAQKAQYYRKWEETTVESTGSVTKFAAELRQIQADMTDLDANSAWPQSHVVRKFINGLGPDFDLFLATWELGITEIPITDNIGVVTQAAVILEQATDAAVQFESSQKERALQTALFAGGSRNDNNTNSANRGTKRKPCDYCGKLHAAPCYIKNPELKLDGWDLKRNISLSPIVWWL
ncbi:hypothetical protein F5B17DRAFT_436952, partial [Nemania serpens]